MTGEFGAKNTARLFRSVEILGILQARKWYFNIPFPILILEAYSYYIYVQQGAGNQQRISRILRAPQAHFVRRYQPGS